MSENAPENARNRVAGSYYAAEGAKAAEKSTYECEIAPIEESPTRIQKSGTAGHGTARGRARGDRGLGTGTIADFGFRIGGVAPPPG